jgi:hypothetical protein
MTVSHRLKRICVCAVSDGIPRRSILVALVVGTILNIINQGDALITRASIDWYKIIFTYLVPYGVCTYGAVSLQLPYILIDAPREHAMVLATGAEDEKRTESG